LTSAFGRSGLPYLVGFCYVLIGSLVFLMKPHQRTSWIFFLFGGTLGVMFAFLLKISELRPYWLSTVHILFYTFSPATILHLAMSFPQERILIKKHPLAQIVPYILSAVLFIGIRAASPLMAEMPRIWSMALTAYLAVALLTLIGSCVELLIRSASEITRLRAKMILLGVAIATSVPLFETVVNTFFRVYIVPGFNYYLPFLIAFPVFIGYSIVKHNLFDIDAIIKRTYGYILTTGAIAGIYGIFVLISNLTIGRYEVTQSPLFPLIFMLAVVFFFNPVRNRAQRVIDRVFYRLEYDYQSTVQAISETMRTLLGLDEIGKSMMSTALGTMFIDAGSIMLLKKQEQKYVPLIRAGQREVHQQGEGEEQRSENITDKQMAAEKEPEGSSANVQGVAAQDLKEVSSEGGLVLDVKDPFVQKMAERKKEATIYDIQEDPFFEDQKGACEKALKELEATLVVPLIYEKDLIGLLALGEKKSGKFYRREDINLLTILANQGAVAIENAWMIEDVIEKERMEEELSIARDLQKSMLPAVCPQVKGLELAALSMQAREVGGDFFDFILMGEDRVGLLVGDVTGKSVSGALVMSASRSVFRMLSEEKLGVAEIMMRANRRTKKDVKSGMFVALLYAVLDSEEKALTLCSAGQTQPVYYSAESGEARLLETVGDTFPLGILEDADYTETRVRLVPGDTIVFYTDGIVEAKNEKDEIFGFEKLIEIVKAGKSLSAEDLLKEIMTRVKEFVRGAPQSDDLTVIVARVEQ
jgi:serine phosphatase RsbU (regulator of sigma subunit)